MAGEPTSSISFGMLEDVLGFRMQRLRAALAVEIAAAMKQWALPRGAFMVLALVQENPGVSQTALARETGIRKTLLVALLHEMEARELLVRKTLAADRRHNQLYITDAGRSVLGEMAKAVMEIEAPIRGALSDETMRQVKGALDRALTVVAAKTA